VGVGRRLRRTGPLTVYSFAIGRAQSDRPTNKLTGRTAYPDNRLSQKHKTLFYQKSSFTLPDLAVRWSDG